MNNKEESLYHMHLQVKKHLDLSTEKWSAIPALVRYKNALDETLLAVREKTRDLVQGSEVHTASKNDMKYMASVKAGILAGAMAAFAEENNDPVMADLAKSQSAFNRQSDVTFANPILAMVASARTNLEALADQGVTEDQLLELETAVDDFEDMIGNPRHIRISSALIRKEVGELITENQSLLTSRLDKSMRRFKLTDPLFYEGYERARVVIG